MEYYLKPIALLFGILIHAVGLYYLIKRLRDIKQNGVTRFLEPVEVIKELDYVGLAAELTQTTKPFGYKKTERDYRNQKIRRISIWRKNKWGINNAVVLIEIENQSSIKNLIEFLHEIKGGLGKTMGYIPFINPVGLQIIVIGKTITASNLTRNPVDIYNNQKVILQSVILMDNSKKILYESTILKTSVLRKYYDSILLAVIDKAGGWKYDIEPYEFAESSLLQND
jgi:hypothetical protein